MQLGGRKNMRNLHRIFIAISLPDYAIKKLANLQDKWKDEVPAVWVKPYNLHITLAFLGNSTDHEVYNICELAKEVGEGQKPFTVELNKILYGPSKDNPRMLWVTGDKSKDLADLKNNFEKLLLDSEDERFLTGKKGISPHITLCRIKQWQWKQIEPEERPQIESDIDIKFDVNSIEVIESRLKRGGAEYTVLESVQFSE